MTDDPRRFTAYTSLPCTVRSRAVRCPLLVGRDDLLVLADRRLDDVAAGRGQFLLLAGEAGIGKTRLLAAIRTKAEARGIWPPSRGRWPPRTATCRRPRSSTWRGR